MTNTIKYFNPTIKTVLFLILFSLLLSSCQSNNEMITVKATVIELKDEIITYDKLWGTKTERRIVVVLEFEYEEETYRVNTYPKVWIGLEIGKEIDYTFWKEGYIR